MTTIEELERLDRATIDLIFILRDSLTDVSALDFWGGRGVTAIETAAAEADNAGYAISRAVRKLQSDSITNQAAERVKAVTEQIDADYDAWAAHVSRNLVQIFALAYVERDQHKRGKKPAEPVLVSNEEPKF